MIIKTIRASRKYIRNLDKEENGKANFVAFAVYNKHTGAHQIMIPFHCNTKTHLHELGHCELGHCIDNRQKYPLSEHVSQEIDAEIYAYEHVGKLVSIESLVNIAHSAIIEYGGWVSYVFNAIINHLKSREYTIDNKQRSYLWDECKEYYQMRKRAI